MKPPWVGGEKWLKLAHVVGEHHPLTALTAARGAHRGERALDAEVRREPPLHLGVRDRKRRTSRGAAQGEKAGEEPAAGFDDRGQGAYVLGAPTRIDRAIARVLPRAVEGVRVLTAEREDVALLERDLHALVARELFRRADRRRREIEARDVVAVTGEPARIV